MIITVPERLVEPTQRRRCGICGKLYYTEDGECGCEVERVDRQNNGF